MINNKYIIWIRHPKTAGTSIRSYLLNPKNPVLENKPNAIYTYDGQYIIQLSNWEKYLDKKISKSKVLSLHTKFIPLFKDKYPDVWNNSFKFSVSRNPYDRFISSWCYNNSTKNIEFERMKYLDYNQLTEHDYYHIRTPQTYNIIENNKLIVDYIIRFENLNDDFNKLLKIIDIPIYNNLLHTRKTDHRHYLSYYSNDMKEYVYELFENDFKYYDYKK